MINDSVLIRAADRVNNYIEKYIDRAGAEEREEVLALFDNMHRLFPHWVIMTCPMMHPEIGYVSKNALSVLGYTDDYLRRISFMEKYFHHVHEADQQDLYHCYHEMQNFFESMLPEEHLKYRAVFYYRFRHASGQYIHMYDEKATVELRSGNLFYVLFRDITAEKAFTGVKMELFCQDEELKKVKEFRPGSRNSLSKREQELVSLMRQGLSTKEIAWYLKISQNTVRNIKSKMFEKYNVNNSIELLNVTV